VLSICYSTCGRVLGQGDYEVSATSEQKSESQFGLLTKKTYFVFSSD
jgi:hypothetical protein